jgi:hypothetical protein
VNVSWFADTQGRIAFTVHALTKEEQIVLRLFMQQNGGNNGSQPGVKLTGWTSESGDPGVRDFTVGVA